jgi:hypothetical protein
MFDPISVHYICSGNTKEKIESVGEVSHTRVSIQVSEVCVHPAAIPTWHSSLAKVISLQSCKVGRLSRWNEEGRNIANGPGHLVRRSLYEGRELRSYLKENTACLYYKDQSVAVM